MLGERGSKGGYGHAGRGLPSGGAVRVSLGLATNAADIAAFLDFVTTAYRDRLPDPVGLEPRMVC
ncbi:hypothetical protein [Actinacidiphila acididurans]|uniref:Uncharacterized protein n=1 Tax=Actinacidiphila acididurans TaxID=2784346 RepID=A0ABS2TQM7_9ACTN|nr:hypothetical protein [Actinacidiphila acididurans]MBM9505635.1 hypothetical protein [Actinacidiphila acididurans]